MDKKILLIDPPGRVKGLNIGLAYLYSSLKNKGFEANVLDLNSSRTPWKNKIQQIKLQNFRYVGLSIKSVASTMATKIANYIKNLNRNIIMIAGGPHITLDGINYLKENNVFDYALVGECENRLPLLIEILNKGGNISQIPGLIYREYKKVVVIEYKDYQDIFIEDLDALPFPLYNNIGRFKDLTYPLITCRGCPYSCVYCSIKKVGGKKWRARTVENIIAELKEVKEKYNITRFDVYDDNFTLDMKRAKALCKALIESGLELEWCFPNGIRADRVDEELVSLLKHSGCKSVFIGIESTDKTVYKTLKRGETLSEIEKTIRLVHKYEMEINGFFIIGLPTSNYKKDISNIDWARRNKLNRAIFNMLIPFPGTELQKWVNSSNNVRIVNDWKRSSYLNDSPVIAFETADYSARERKKAFYKTNLAFFNYLAVYNDRNSIVKSTYSIIISIIKYDFMRIFTHIKYIIKNYRVVFRKVYELHSDDFLFQIRWHR